VEFLVRRGLKAVGDLLTAEQLMQRWQIDNDKYRQLLKLGLPTIRFEDDSVRHPEVAVDEWFCQSVKGHRAICEKIQLDGRREETQEQLGGLDPECLSIEDAAKFLGVRIPAIEHLIRTHQLSYVQLGAQRGRVVPVEALRKLIQAKLQPTSDELRKKRKRL
jgi:hypothetical protein